MLCFEFLAPAYWCYPNYVITFYAEFLLPYVSAPLTSFLAHEAFPFHPSQGFVCLFVCFNYGRVSLFCFLRQKLFFSAFHLSAVFSIFFAPRDTHFPIEVNEEDRKSEKGGPEAGTRVEMGGVGARETE